MDLTGHSTDFVVDTSFPEGMRCFVRLGQQRWPGLFLYGEPLPPGAPAEWRLPEPDDDGFSGIVTFSSGQEMEDFWEEHGYALDAARQGPYAVFYRHHAQQLHATTVSGVHVSSPEAEAAVEGTGLLLSEYYAVSLVTPEDPDIDPFSRSVLNDFVASFGGSTSAM
ncbi:hypothetical protein ACIRD9_17475 [Streptomyces violaceus]|jgi:hypothetical protein|uniref:hypothetical protein n=1 Tax=Streptomyces violaceus TaxID=1936 RepID=UPI0037FE5A6D